MAYESDGRVNIVIILSCKIEYIYFLEISNLYENLFHNKY
jgi:hypothetical protein